jgi:hypothetical protein
VRDALPHIVHRRHFPIVWVVPIIASLIGIAMLVHSWLAAGPRIYIEFKEARGRASGVPDQGPSRTTYAGAGTQACGRQPLSGAEMKIVAVLITSVAAALAAACASTPIKYYTTSSGRADREGPS